LTLHGVLYKLNGDGPFPAVLYSHGSAPGMNNNEAFERLGPVLVARGLTMFAPYRRGQGLSSGAGPFIQDEMDTAGRKGGTEAYKSTMIRLLKEDHMDDQMAGLAWLKQQPFVSVDRIATVGNSFGGIEVVLGSAKEEFCAAVDIAGAAQAWAQSPELRKLLIESARNSKTPIFFLQAENDYDLSPSRVLTSEIEKVGKVSQLKIYPAFGKSAVQGHSFGYLGTSTWISDVTPFLEKRCQ
jgi:carboxymethylenebutenolidase